MYITQPYDDALRYILENGKKTSNRTGIDCLTVFSMKQVYQIDEYFPLLTKRKLFPKSVFAELLWMLSGSTDNNKLKELGTNFWTPWADPNNPLNKDFYEKTNFPKGYLGPIYGFQLRHFGGKYAPGKENDVEPGYEGFDQISWLVNEIKTNPRSRRLIVSMWNPPDLHLMRLPPCHYSFHVYIDNQKRMSLLLNQRSADFCAGVPANLQFYSALCYMLAQQTGHTPYQFIHHTEDSQIYINQIEQAKEYLSRPVFDSPKLILNKAKNIFGYTTNDFQIVEYKHGDLIKMPIAI